MIVNRNLYAGFLCETFHKIPVFERRLTGNVIELHAFGKSKYPFPFFRFARNKHPGTYYFHAFTLCVFQKFLAGGSIKVIIKFFITPFSADSLFGKNFKVLHTDREKQYSITDSIEDNIFPEDVEMLHVMFEKASTGHHMSQGLFRRKTDDGLMYLYAKVRLLGINSTGNSKMFYMGIIDMSDTIRRLGLTN